MFTPWPSYSLNARRLEQRAQDFSRPLLWFRLEIEFLSASFCFINDVLLEHLKCIAWQNGKIPQYCQKSINHCTQARARKSVYNVLYIKEFTLFRQVLADKQWQQKRRVGLNERKPETRHQWCNPLGVGSRGVDMNYFSFLFYLLTETVRVVTSNKVSVLLYLF